MADPSFTFRLERVRALRERAEDHAREALAGSISVRLEGETTLRSASAGVESARAARRASAGGRESTGADLLAGHAYLEKLQRAREAAALDLDRQDAEVDARRFALGTAARERQMLERLKDRRRAEHALAASRRADAATDEMALAMHRRRETAA